MPRVITGIRTDEHDRVTHVRWFEVVWDPETGVKQGEVLIADVIEAVDACHSDSVYAGFGGKLPRVRTVAFADGKESIQDAHATPAGRRLRDLPRV